jgi:hypothetical protein
MLHGIVLDMVEMHGMDKRQVGVFSPADPWGDTYLTSQHACACAG